MNHLFLESYAQCFFHSWVRTLDAENFLHSFLPSSISLSLPPFPHEWCLLVWALVWVGFTNSHLWDFSLISWNMPFNGVTDKTGNFRSLRIAMKTVGYGWSVWAGMATVVDLLGGGANSVELWRLQRVRRTATWRPGALPQWEPWVRKKAQICFWVGSRHVSHVHDQRGMQREGCVWKTRRTLARQVLMSVVKVTGKVGSWARQEVLLYLIWVFIILSS